MYWKEYNSNLEALSKSLLKYNKGSSFNYVEDSFYNHVRDIVAIEIANLIALVEEKVRVIDYGSNLISWSNIQNKIDTKRLHVDIYDPFAKKNCEDLTKTLNFTCKKYSDLDSIQSNEYDLSLFGSVLQYIDDFYEIFLNNPALRSRKVIFTHTPLSMSEEIVSKQFSDFKGNQKIYSYKDILEIMSEFGFHCIFRSTLDPKYAKPEKKFLKRIIYGNLIFSSENKAHNK